MSTLIDNSITIYEALEHIRNAKTEFGKLLDGSYVGFGSDFIVRSALILYGDVVKSNINKQIAEDLKNIGRISKRFSRTSKKY